MSNLIGAILAYMFGLIGAIIVSNIVGIEIKLGVGLYLITFFAIQAKDNFSAHIKEFVKSEDR